MLDVAQLAGCAGPHLHFVEAEAARAAGAQGKRPGAWFTGSVRGVRSRDGLFDELARALRLPSYFGRNWDALDECLRDLPERVGETSCVLVLSGALAGWQEAPLLMAQLVEVWLSAAAECQRAGAGLHLVFAW